MLPQAYTSVENCSSLSNFHIIHYKFLSLFKKGAGGKCALDKVDTISEIFSKAWVCLLR